MQAVTAQLKLSPQDWTSVLPVIATTLNENSLDHLGRCSDGTARSPPEFMTFIETRHQILRVLPRTRNRAEAKKLEHSHDIKVTKINNMQASLHKMHKEVDRLLSNRRKKAVSWHNLATNFFSPSFNVGDLVVVRHETDRCQKLRFKWFGPRRITSVQSPLVYNVTPFSSSKTECVQCA